MQILTRDTKSCRNPSPLVNPTKVPKTEGLTLDQITEDPPEQLLLPTQPSSPWLSRKAKRIDFPEREAANRLLGKLGEQFVVGLERQRLLTAGREDLAGKVEQVSETIGDGLGFDVLSFEEKDDSEKLIEVRTTVLGKFFPFRRDRDGGPLLRGDGGEILSVQGLRLCSITAAVCPEGLAAGSVSARSAGVPGHDLMCAFTGRG